MLTYNWGGETLPFFYLMKERNNLYTHSDGVYSVLEHWGVTPLMTGNNAAELSILKAKENKKLFFKIKNEFNTQDKFVEFFADKLYSVESRSHITVVEKNEHKLSLKVFYTYRRRNKGVHYFKVRKSMYFLTVNLNTGDLYIGHLIGYQNKRKISRSIRKNVFNEQTINSFKATLTTILNDNTQIPIVGPLNTQNVIEEIKKVFINELEKYHGGSFRYNTFVEVLYEFYLKKKDIKYPNNFNVFTKKWGVLPTKKELTKCGMKFIDALMLKNKLKGDRVKKALHECNYFNGGGLYLELVDIFGTDWVHQTPGVLKSCFEKENSSPLSIHNFEVLNKTEKRRCWDFLVEKNLMIPEGTVEHLSIRVIRDHVEFISFLRNEGVEVSWKAKNFEDFVHEHTQLSQLVSDYRKGDFKRIYPEGYYDVFVRPILIDNQFYVTNILDSTSTYNDESSFQSNCVRTYMSRAASFIISVRKGQERATVEYKITKNPKDSEFEVKREQYLGKFNKGLDESWKNVLEKVDERVKFVLSEWGYDILLEKKTKVGKTITSEIEFTDLGYPKWKNSTIFETSNNSFFLDDF